MFSCFQLTSPQQQPSAFLRQGVKEAWGSGEGGILLEGWLALGLGLETCTHALDPPRLDVDSFCSLRDPPTSPQISQGRLAKEPEASGKESKQAHRRQVTGPVPFRSNSSFGTIFPVRAPLNSAHPRGTLSYVILAKGKISGAAWASQHPQSQTLCCVKNPLTTSPCNPASRSQPGSIYPGLGVFSCEKNITSISISLPGGAGTRQHSPPVSTPQHCSKSVGQSLVLVTLVTLAWSTPLPPYSPSPQGGGVISVPNI